MNDVYVILGGESADPRMAHLLALMERTHMDLKQAKEAIDEVAADVEKIKENDAAILTAVTTTQQAQQAKIVEMQGMIDALTAQAEGQPELLDAIEAVKAKAEEVKQDSDATLAAVGQAPPVPPA